MEKECIDLVELQNGLGQSLREAFPGLFWVKAEIASMSVRRGHCYLDLSQSVDGNVVAQVRAIIWSSTYLQIAPYFEFATGSKLDVGQQVCLQAGVNYSPLYGLSLTVSDIDPDYTIGDAQRRRALTLERLAREGLLDTQKQLNLPQFPRTLAVISSESAAGYRDFVRQLHDNTRGYGFRTDLFPCAVQGSGCAAEVAAAVRAVESGGTDYDAVLILRGGGGKLDLSCFDEWEMCEAIARCRIPVLTAVGHDQDVHICDMVAFRSLKTPTALADFFLDIFTEAEARLDMLGIRLESAARSRLSLLKGKLDNLACRLDAADPLRLLEKGYVVVLGPDGRPLRSVDKARGGDRLAVLLRDGRIEASVTDIRKIK